MNDVKEICELALDAPAPPLRDPAEALAIARRSVRRRERVTVGAAALAVVAAASATAIDRPWTRCLRDGSGFHDTGHGDPTDDGHTAGRTGRTQPRGRPRSWSTDRPDSHRCRAVRVRRDPGVFLPGRRPHRNLGLGSRRQTLTSP